MAILENLDNPLYPEPWNKQTTQGYESNLGLLQKNESSINDGLALKVFQDYCCDSCLCTSENDHKK